MTSRTLKRAAKEATAATASTKVATKKTKFFYEGEVLKTEKQVRKRDGFKGALPEREENGVLRFDGYETFYPNLTPKEILQRGSFGGTYFRPIYSSVTKTDYDQMWLELPQDWLAGMKVKRAVHSSHYDQNVNKFKCKCGGDLDMWESSGWITEIDPYGWFMWYCRFYLGRRCYDDERQIKRWRNFASDKGRFRNSLITMIWKKEKKWNDHIVSPKIRQGLQHWAYELTEVDFDARK